MLLEEWSKLGSNLEQLPSVQRQITEGRSRIAIQRCRGTDG